MPKVNGKLILTNRCVLFSHYTLKASAMQQQRDIKIIIIIRCNYVWPTNKNK